MMGVAGNLADVIDDDRSTRSSVTPALSGVVFPRTQFGTIIQASNAAPITAPRSIELANLIVVELAVVRDERAAIGMARPDRTVEVVERFAKAFVAEMGDVEDHAEAIHLAQQLPAAHAEITLSVGALRVRARPVMRRTDSAQALPVRAFEMPDRDERISAFEAEHVADGHVDGTRSPIRRRWRSRPVACRAPAPSRRALPSRDTRRAAPASCAHACSGECQPGNGCSRVRRSGRSASRRRGRRRRGASPGTTTVPLPRSGLSVMTVLARADFSIGRDRSRFHSRAFIARSRCASTISIQHSSIRAFSIRIRSHHEHARQPEDRDDRLEHGPRRHGLRHAHVEVLLQRARIRRRSRGSR